jgi:molybdopterin-guanine dinucleotide biosynthesis protein A
VIGAILAGGLGRRMGADKPSRQLAGRPLAAYPAAALGAVCERVAIVAKAGTPLPPLDGVERWDEPDEPRHPLTGIMFALERAGEPVLVCAADMPFVTRDVCERLIHARALARTGARLQPLLGVYLPEWLPTLRAAEPDAPLTRTVEALAPATIDLPEEVVRSIDTPEALRSAEEDQRRHEKRGRDLDAKQDLRHG